MELQIPTPTAVRAQLDDQLATVRRLNRGLTDRAVGGSLVVLDAQERALARTRPEMLRAYGELQVAIARRVVTEAAIVQHRLIG